MTPEPGKLIERIASLSYVTQRFIEKIHPKLIKFASGRTVPYDQFKLDRDPEIGRPLPGYRKDDVAVVDVIEASYVRVVKFVLAIGHHALLRNCHACFLIDGITRKGALHFLRYQFSNTNMQSQKYKDQGSFEYLLPGEDEAPAHVRRKIEAHMASIQAMYEDLRETGVDAEWSRCVYPNNIAQTMTFETNFEQYRHMFDCLCDDDYVSENRDVCMDMLRILKAKAPEFFHDFILRDDEKSAYRRASKYARNKQVNWMMSPAEKAEFGLEVHQVPGQEKDIE
jgi:thymidylate synthase ThyX